MFLQLFQACFSDFYRGWYYSILIITSCISLLSYRRVGKAFKWICVLIILTCISEFTAKYFVLRFKENGMVYNIFTPIEYFMYVNIYLIFLHSKLWKPILYSSITLLVIVGIINIIYFHQELTEPPTNTINVETVMLVFLSLLLFINIREKPIYENILTEGVFWFNSAVFIYYQLNIIIWAFYEIMYNTEDAPPIIQRMLLFSSGLLYIFYAFSVLLNYYSKKFLPKNA